MKYAYNEDEKGIIWIQISYWAGIRPRLVTTYVIELGRNETLS